MEKDRSDMPPTGVTRIKIGSAQAHFGRGTDNAIPRSWRAESVAPSQEYNLCRFVNEADRVYVAHNLPEPVVRDIFDCGPAGGEYRVSWEEISIGIMLAGYMLAGSAVLLKVAAFGALFAG